MLTNNEAVEIAVKYIQSVLTSTEPILLEEIELTEDGKFWLITISVNDPLPATILTYSFGKPRRYKIVKIDRENGEVISMKIRESKKQE